MSEGGARGERVIAGEAGEVRVLFTNRAIAEVEQVTGKSIIDIAQGFQEARSGVREVGTLLRAGMEAARRDARSGGRAVTLDDAFEVMDDVGFGVAATAVMEAVAEVLGHGASTDPNG